MENPYGPDALLTRRAADGTQIVVSRFGGHVLSWEAAGKERLFVSPIPPDQGGMYFRGGVPVCWPQFSGRGSLPVHGFARTSWWEEVPEDGNPSQAELHLRLVDDEETRSIWPHAFVLDVRITADATSLLVRLDVRNSDAHPWSFTGALHTVLRVDDLAQVRLSGVEGLWRQRSSDNSEQPPFREPLSFSGVVGERFRGVRGPIELRQPSGTIIIDQQGFSDAVLWNPGEQRAAQFNIAPAELSTFISVEAAQAFDPIELAPGEVWTGWQRLRLASQLDGFS